LESGFKGQGAVFSTDGSFYSGNLKRDFKEGNGAMIFSDGSLFKGQYKDGKPVEGTMTYTNGLRIKGSYSSGTGKQVLKDGSLYSG
jgi:hypothetical protein